VSIEIDHILIDALIGKVGSGTQVTGNPTYQLTRDEATTSFVLDFLLGFLIIEESDDRLLFTVARARFARATRYEHRTYQE
jgi:hypothetical protein